MDEALIEIINEVITYIAERTDVPLNEHIHIALTDHISFALKRKERRALSYIEIRFYMKHVRYTLKNIGWEIALFVIIKEKLGVDLGMDEIGFIALQYLQCHD